MIEVLFWNTETIDRYRRDDEKVFSFSDSTRLGMKPFITSFLLIGTAVVFKFFVALPLEASPAHRRDWVHAFGGES